MLVLRWPPPLALRLPKGQGHGQGRGAPARTRARARTRPRARAAPRPTTTSPIRPPTRDSTILTTPPSSFLTLPPTLMLQFPGRRRPEPRCLKRRSPTRHVLAWFGFLVDEASIEMAFRNWLRNTGEEFSVTCPIRVSHFGTSWTSRHVLATCWTSWTCIGDMLDIKLSGH